ncbi:MAG: antibiotic biosynthesis monooxygenase, partial [Actinomycetota bacterium]|nr:antibiotic biosynthesis monooxygenase [Actinomycetota bacterium]
YGTVARIKVSAGKDEALAAHMRKYEDVSMAGFVSSALYKLDAGAGEHALTVIFESKEAYRANAESPGQDERYQEFRELLDADPEWNDGEVVLRQVAP